MTIASNVSCVGLVAAMLVVMPASAQETANKFEIALAVPLLSYAKMTGTLGGWETDVVLPDAVETTTKGSGLGDGVVLELGYGIGRFLVPGAILRVAESSTASKIGAQSGTASDVQTSSVFIGPKLDVMFAPRAKLRPVLGVAGGYASNSRTAAGSASVGGFALLGRAGMCFFAATAFSVNAMVEVGWRSVSGDFDTADIGGSSGTRSVTVSGSEYSIALQLGIAGWL